jgi:hypothetical protein
MFAFDVIPMVLIVIPSKRSLRSSVMLSEAKHPYHLNHSWK